MRSTLRRLVTPLAIALTMSALAACAVYSPAPGPAYYSGGYYYGPSVYVGGGGYYHRHW